MSDQVQRVVKILSRLSAGHVFTMQELHAYFLHETDDMKTVTKRQLERDIRAIMDAGVPIDVERANRTVTYSLKKGAGISAMTMAAASGDSFALYMLKASLPILKDSPLQEIVSELKSELDEYLPGDVDLTDTLLASIGLGHYAGTINSDILTGVVASVAQKQWIKVIYGEQSTSQLMFPYRVIPYLGRLYIAAWSDKHQNYSVYAIDKIKLMYDAPVKPPKTPVFDLDKFMSTRFGLWEDPQRECADIEIDMVTPQHADFFMSSYWHPSQKIRKRIDGTLRIEMKAGVSPELVSWILHWAPHLKVIKPQRLIDDVHSRAQQLLNL